MPSKDLVVDWESLFSNFDNDRMAIAMVIEAFLESIDESLAKVQVAAKAKEAKALAMSAHSIKGAILNFGSGEAVALAQELENQGYEGLQNNMNEVLKNFEAAVATLIAELKAESLRYQEAS